MIAEAILKPADGILRVLLFLVAGASVFLLYGWDSQSPVVERLTRLLQYEFGSLYGEAITPLSIIELTVTVSLWYWAARCTREFVYRFVLSRSKDLGVRNSIA